MGVLNGAQRGGDSCARARLSRGPSLASARLGRAFHRRAAAAIGHAEALAGARFYTRRARRDLGLPRF
jgi:hypothetical protein